MVTRTRRTQPPTDYDPTAYPSFAVTVDLVVLALVDEVLNVLLVRRREDPFAGRWALPGGFKRPDETLDQAAARELGEETGVHAVPALRQFQSYGDPGRDPRMNVVTVAYLVVLRQPVEVVAGSDAEAATWMPIGEVLGRSVALAFDHRRILSDAIERVRSELESTDLATAFLPSTFTLSRLRSVYEAVWGVTLDSANFRRKLAASDGWIVPTGRRIASGSEGGKPAELFRVGRAWKNGSPIRRPASRARLSGARA